MKVKVTEARRVHPLTARYTQARKSPITTLWTCPTLGQKQRNTHWLQHLWLNLISNTTNHWTDFNVLYCILYNHFFGLEIVKKSALEQPYLVEVPVVQLSTGIFAPHNLPFVERKGVQGCNIGQNSDDRDSITCTSEGDDVPRSVGQTSREL